MAKVKRKKVIQFLFGFLPLVQSNEHVLDSVYLENGHLNVGTVRDHGILLETLEKLKEKAENLDGNTNLMIKIRTTFDFSLDLTSTRKMTGHSVINNQVFKNLATRAQALIDQRKEICGRSKRSWDILGDLLNDITGVPSAEMHNNVVQRLDTLDSGMNTIISHGKAMTQEIKATTLISLENSKQIEKMAGILDNNLQELQIIEQNQLVLANVMNFASNAERIMELASLELIQSENILLLAKMNKANERGLDKDTLRQAFNHTIDADMRPATENTDVLYSLDIFQASCNERKIFLTCKIPLINKQKPRNLTLLTLKEKLTADTDLTQFAFRLTSLDRKKHSYMTLSDVEKCMDLDSFMICNKRDIEIDDSMTGRILVYDVTPNRIIINAQGDTFIHCNKNITLFNYQEPMISFIPSGCMVSHKFFSIQDIETNNWGLTQADFRVPIFNFTMIDKDINFRTQHKMIKDIEGKMKFTENKLLNTVVNITRLQQQQLDNERALHKQQQQHRKILHYSIGGGILFTGSFLTSVLLLCLCISITCKKIRDLRNEVFN